MIDRRRHVCDGEQTTLLAHLGNLSFRVGRSLKLDPDARTIVGDEEATRLLKRSGRKEFRIPDQV